MQTLPPEENKRSVNADVAGDTSTKTGILVLVEIVCYMEMSWQLFLMKTWFVGQEGQHSLLIIRSVF